MGKAIEKFKFLFKEKKKSTIAIMMMVLVIVGYFIFKSNSVVVETLTVKHTDFINQVSVSGKVVSASNVDLGFKASGRVDKIYFKVGDKVKKGQTIASLDASDAQGQLDIARANYEKVINGATNTDIAVAQAAVETAQVALDQTKLQQDLLIKNAKKNLLNSDFVVTSNDQYQLTNQIPPIISGTYLKDTEGQIVINEYYSSGGVSFKTSGMVESSGMARADVPQPIGDTGLYIKFPGTSNDQIKWILEIPSTQSAQYLSNLNAYNSALSNQTQAIANATAVLNQAKSALVLKQSSARPEDVAATNGSLLVAQGAYNDRFIFAPFEGVITRIDAKVGEITSVNMPLISMIDAGTFQIESYVPEVNIADIKLGDTANTTLDAYGTEVSFLAKVVSIDPAETIRDGVSTYKVKLQFDQQDDRIRSGMTANVLVTTMEKPNVVVLPEGVIFEKNGQKFVQLRKTDDQTMDVSITAGVKSSLGQTEITSGLSDGDIVILNPVVK